MAAVTAGAAALRLVHIGQVPPDPFYDAAVRSMALSWHNFFFGVYDPGGSLSIDKPPVDLWLQVLSTKALGFSSTTLKLPEALAGIASVPLLYVAVRRMWSGPAGIAAAVAMAVLPIEVITARSDTMDGVMMLVIVLALLLVVRAIETGRLAYLLAGAAALGVAFDVKLLESLVALPGLAVLAYLGLPGSRVRRLLGLTAAAAVYVAVALAWLTATLLFPAHDRPYAIGSTNGSAWNAAFVFNGSDRLGSKSPEPGATVYEAGHRYPVATQEQRDHIPIVPPSPTRLLSTVGPLSGERLGLEVLVALLLGIPALAWGALGERTAGHARERSGEGDPDERADGDAGERSGEGGRSAGHARERAGEDDPHERAEGPAPHPPEGASDADAKRALAHRMRRASAGGLGVWMLTGIVLYSHMVRLHPRYVEAFTPAVAAMLGIGVAWASEPLTTRAGAIGARCDGARSAPGSGCAWCCCWLRSRSSCTTASACCMGWRRHGGCRWPARCALARSSPWRSCARPRAGLAAAGRGCDGDGAGGGAGDSPEGGLHRDRRSHQRRRARGRAPGRPAAPVERIPARPPGRRVLSGGSRVGDGGRLADRAGRPPDPRTDHI